MFRTTRTVAGYPLRFTWEGGEYIEVAFVGGTTFDVINTYGGDGTRLNVDRPSFLEAVHGYVTDPDTDHAHDLREYALAGYAGYAG